MNTEISDGYHTMDELYYHRGVLFSVICNQNKSLAWKSRKHSDDQMYDGMFIVGIDTPEGQYTYHCEMIFGIYLMLKNLSMLQTGMVIDQKIL